MDTMFPEAKAHDIANNDANIEAMFANEFTLRRFEERSSQDNVFWGLLERDIEMARKAR